MNKKFFSGKYLLLFIVSFLFLGGCSQTKDSLILPDYYNKIKTNTGKITQKNLLPPKTIEQELAEQGKMKKFANSEELREFLENSVSTEGGNNFYFEKNKADFSLDAMAPMGDMPTSAWLGRETKSITQSEDAKNNDYSTTNVQVGGVDEADIIKTDGDYIYAVSGSKVYIVSARPAEKAQIIATIEFDSRPRDIYINDNNLVVFGNDQQINKDNKFSYIRRGIYQFFKVYDLSNKLKPKLVRDLSLEGNYASSRLIGDYVYFVSNLYNNYFLDDDFLLPVVIDNGEVISGKCKKEKRCLKPAVFYFDMPYREFDFVSVFAINIKNNSEPINEEIYLLSNNQNMYVSPNNIYLSYTKYISEYDLQMEVLRELIYPQLSEKTQSKIAEIENVPSYILNKREKNSKISRFLERYMAKLSDKEKEQWEKDLAVAMKAKYQDISKELEKTVIHKIAINKNKLTYIASGEVTGRVLNQFSLDEADGYLRVATTKGRTWSNFVEEENKDSYNNLYVLNKDLQIVGQVENLAQGETIRSVRFMQNRAYLVTFKQIDPLFVIGLDNPENPAVLGYLKIPGYSDYLHPYDNTTLIGFGKDAEESEWGGVRTKGLKLSLFDVSDVAHPKEIDTYIMGEAGSDSPALRDHKAFLFAKEKNLLVVPVRIREKTDRGNATVFNGAAVFYVDKKGFKLSGKIKHPALSTHNFKPDYLFSPYIKRSFYIDDNLCTFSDNYIKINKLSDLSEVNLIKFEQKSFPHPILPYQPVLPRVKSGETNINE